MKGYTNLDELLHPDLPVEKRNDIWVRESKTTFDYSERRTFAHNEGYVPSTIRDWALQALDRALARVIAGDVDRLPDFDSANVLEVSIKIEPSPKAGKGKIAETPSID